MARALRHVINTRGRRCEDPQLPVVLFALSVMATYAVTLLPPWLRVLVGEKMQNHVNEVLEKAVLSAVAQTKGAVVGKHLTVSVSNQVLKRAADYALVLAPELIGQATKGSADALKKMIMARMEDLLLPPSSFDVSKSAKVASETGKTDFGSMISKGLGGK